MKQRQTSAADIRPSTPDISLKLEREAVAFGDRGKLFLWNSINKRWAFMKEIKNLCQLAFGSWIVAH